MHMFCFLVWIVLPWAAVVAVSRAAEHTVTSCPNVTVVKDFNTTAYLGAWYEIRRYPARFQQAASCVSTHYSFKDDKNIATLARMFNATTKKYVTKEGTMRRINANSTEAKLLATFTTSKVEADYWVLGTDYTSYAVAWWCRHNADQNYTLYNWILSRTKKLPLDAESAVKKTLTENNISYDNIFTVTKQENCPSENGDI